MKCSKCDANNPSSAKFCGTCGSKVIHKKGKKRKVTKKRLYYIIGVIVILAILIIPSETATRTERMPYETTETYSAQEPYKSTEYYTDTEQYTDKECNDVRLTKNLKWGKSTASCIDTDCDSYKSVCITTNWLGNCLEYQDVCQSTTCSKYKVSCNIILKNLDDKGGTFSFEGKQITTSGTEYVIKRFSEYLQPGDEKSFNWEYTAKAGELGNCHYGNFETPTKTECENIVKSKTVQKSRPVTEYRGVTKTRTVTKVRIDTIYYRVNRWFGFKLPWSKENRVRGQTQ